MSEWKDQLQVFYETRARDIGRRELSVALLSHASGRDPRLWYKPEVYKDFINSLREQLVLSPAHRLLEVGCAAGFLALGLSPLVKKYIGIDLAKEPIKIARRLGLLNAEFSQAEGKRLPFSDNSFERVVCADVFTNIPDKEEAFLIIKEMARVAKLGGRVMVASLADEETREIFEARCQEVAQEFDELYGPVESVERRPGLLGRYLKTLLPNRQQDRGQALCYYFNKDDMRRFGEMLGMETQICRIFPKSPYYDYRFNVVYTKGEPLCKSSNTVT